MGVWLLARPRGLKLSPLENAHRREFLNALVNGCSADIAGTSHFEERYSGIGSNQSKNLPIEFIKFVAHGIVLVLLTIHFCTTIVDTQGERLLEGFLHVGDDSHRCLLIGFQTDCQMLGIFC